MATLLNQTISNPFSGTPARPSFRFDEPFNFPNAVFDRDAVNFASIIQDRRQQPSPASIFSVVSAPTFKNDENLPPILRRKSGATQPRSVSSQVAKGWGKSGFQGQIRPRNFTHQPSVKDADVADTKNAQFHLTEPRIVDEGRTENAVSVRILADSPIAHDGFRPLTPTLSISTTLSKTVPESGTDDNRITHGQNIALTPETGLLSRIRELRLESANKNTDLSDKSPIQNEYPMHQQRSSDSSSGFVHSMKTASVTNASFSIYPRVSNLYKSGESHYFFGSQARASVDSDRPLSSYSIDGASTKRGFERQQIIDELVTTEEGYVADLKALLYLYSTVLVSTSTISSRIGSATLRNVNEILGIHEKMLQRFHDVRLRAAARRWADTAAPERLVQHRRTHLRSSDRTSCTPTPRARRLTQSTDSTYVPTRQTQPYSCAEPIDVYEITAIFKDTLKDFYVYEEFCANYDFIGRELQRHTPGSWPTLDLGLESLARAIVAIEQRNATDKKGLTVGDLLIKPIQRMTKYPLLLEQLLHKTPVSDAPGTHTELAIVLQDVRNAVQMINLATEDHFTRLSIQRRWLLRDRLDLSRLNITTEQFKNLGTLELCGVLHMAYQSVSTVSGGYTLCAIFEDHLLIAFPIPHNGAFEAVALIQLGNVKVVSSTDGRGLQCASTLFTWKISFACAGHFHELIFSACSKVEEESWTAAMRGEFGTAVNGQSSTGFVRDIATCIAINLKSTGIVFTSQNSLSRESSIQRAATVARRTSISQVIIRNTHNLQDLQGYRDSSIYQSAINRSQSHATTKRIPVLDPKRSSRTRIESNIADIWTREILPFPSMVGSRGGQIIRASAGSLARKLSLASIHSSFSKSRTASFSTISRKSYDMFNESKSTFEVRRRDVDHGHVSQMKPRDIPEVDDMRSVVGRMIGAGLTSVKKDSISKNKSGNKSSLQDIGPDDPATIFYEHSANLTSKQELIEGDCTKDSEGSNGNGVLFVRTKRKRWSNPITKLKGFGSEAMNILQSGSSRG